MEIPAKRGGADEKNPGEPSARLLLQQARAYVQAESDRAGGMQTRATAIVATAGVVLGLTITTLVLGATLVLLLSAAALGVVALWPPGSAAAPVEEIEDYVLPESIGGPERDTAAALISSLTTELASTRESNDVKSRWLRAGMVVLAFGALGAAVQGAAIGLSDPKDPASTSSSPSVTIEDEP